jgi:hypothetical protein
VLRKDGKIVTMYYYNVHSGRYIAATIWDPGKGK